MQEHQDVALARPARVVPSLPTQLALANLGHLSGGPTLVIGFGPELPEALDDPVVFQTDLCAFRACAHLPDAHLGAWFSSESRFGSVVLELPAAAERARMMVAMAGAAMAPGGVLALIGRNDAGIRSAGKHLADLIGEPRVLDYRFHCRALTATLQREPAPARLGDWLSKFRLGDLSITSYPGVFAHGRLDEGTRVLLDALEVPADARALDVGCGSGAIGAWLGARGISVECVDVDMLAVAAAERSLAPFGTARAFTSDVFSDVSGRYSHIVSNPPFHAGVRTTSHVAIRMIEEAPAHLERDGELWLVANRFLPYTTSLQRTFASVEVVFEDRRFRVYRAR